MPRWRRKNGKRKAVLLAAYAKGYRVGDDGTPYNPKEKPLSTWLYEGYPAFGFWHEGKKFNVLVHRLQAYQIWGDDIFESGILVRHKDNDRLNPCRNNLKLDTAYENYHDNSDETNERTKANLKSQQRAEPTEEELQQMDEIGF